MSTDYDRACEAAGVLERRLGRRPDVAIVLGSGLSPLADALEAAVAVGTEQVPHWPRSAVPGHANRLVGGRLAGRDVIVLAGRPHLYEGFEPSAVAFPIRACALLGARVIVLTNAAGAVNDRFTAGTLMLIDDHINLMGTNPLRGPNDDRFGPRFPDMGDVYSRRLRAIAHRVAQALDLRLEHGVYAALAGPSYETPAEIRFLRVIGVDAVGMSTVPEAIAARHVGMEVLGVSCIANPAAEVGAAPLGHEDVLAAVAGAVPQLTALVQTVVAEA